ncbi:MAG: hypothetical protein AB7O65_00720 [Candidatus Korobacteraceae bacterium]
MDIQQILSHLRSERANIDKAIAALEQIGSGTPLRGVSKNGRGGRTRGRRTMSAAARKKISEMMKARWAARRKKSKA